MANSVDPDQTAPTGAVCSMSMLSASILNLSVLLGNYFSRKHFQSIFSGRFKGNPFSASCNFCCLLLLSAHVLR